MQRTGGGNRDRVLIEPGGLRRGARRLRDANVELEQVSRRMDAEAMPEMPDGMVAFVRTELERIAALLADQTVTYRESSVELDRRAFWTDIADAIASGTQLTATQTRTFVSYLKDGTLVGYAEPWQAELAGSYVGTLYRSHLEDPQRLTELSDILAQNEANAGFSAGFVQSFGSGSLLGVPRVLQGMEVAPLYRPGTRDGLAATPPLAAAAPGVAERLGTAGYRLERDPRELVTPFSLAFATAVASGKLDRKTEDEVAGHDDTWAVGQLASQGDFSTQFLVGLAGGGLVRRVLAEATGAQPQAYAFGAFWSGGATLPVDGKTLVLQSLARRPDAAGRALMAPLAFGPEGFTGPEAAAAQKLGTPLELLYRYGRFDDGGASFAAAFAKGVDGLLEAGDPAAAADLAERMGSEVLRDARDPNLHDLGIVTDSLAGVLGKHYLGDLHAAAAASVSAFDWDGDGDGALGSSTMGLAFSHRQTIGLFRAFLDRPETGDRILVDIGRYQAELADANAVPRPPVPDWVDRLRGFDRLLTAART
ncbi:MAG TPA: hypothetical protein VGF23_10320 [Gaiellaceae bacterium]